MYKDYSKEFISYKLGLKAKQEGFNEPCFGRWLYDNGKYVIQLGFERSDDLGEFDARDVKALTHQQYKIHRWNVKT